MYRFALRPKWIVGHLIALVAIVAFVNFGFWQLRRLDERRDANAEVEAVADLGAVDLVELDDADEAREWRRALATGEFVAEDEVVVRNRNSAQGAPGYHVVTPLLLDDGRAVLVLRGWVPTVVVEDGRVVGVDPPAGTVEVLGRIREGEERRGIGARDPDEGALDVLSRVDVERIDAQTDLPLLDVYLELVEPAPDDPTGLPQPVEAPELGEGPHLGYAVQWFLFAAVVLVGYPVLLRRTARGGDEIVDEPEDEREGEDALRR